MRRLMVALIVVFVACCEALDVLMKWLAEKWPRRR